MAFSSKSKLIAAMAALALLGACADFQNRWDTVSYRAGDAPASNQAIHTISPWPPNVEETKIPGGSG